MQLLHAMGFRGEFAPYTPTDGGVIIITGLGIAAAVAWRRRLANRLEPADREAGLRRFDRLLAGFFVFAYLIALARELMPDRISWQQSLPLHVCDWALLCAIVAFAFNWRPARTLLHYFGLTLSIQAYITPVLTAGPAYGQFYLSWLFHGAIMVAAVVDVLARGYRPDWDDYRIAMRWGAAYILLVFPLDAIFGWNYGYVGPGDPATLSRARTLMLFGEWPMRVPLMYITACSALALMTLAWNLRAARAWLARWPEPSALEIQPR